MRWGGGEGWWKSHLKRCLRFFLTQFLSPIEGPAMSVMEGGRWSVWLVGWQKSRPKNLTALFDFFGRYFRQPISPINSFENLFAIFSATIFVIETSFPIKKGIFRCLLSFKGDLGPRNGFLAFSQKITLFWKKLVSNKIFDTSFCDKKVMLIFGVRRLLSLKNCQMRPPKQFSAVFSENIAFFKKLLNKIFKK